MRPRLALSMANTTPDKPTVMGGPSHIDLFDPKPGLQKWHGQPLPDSMTKDLKLAFIKKDAKVLASPPALCPSRARRSGSTLPAAGESAAGWR